MNWKLTGLYIIIIFAVSCSKDSCPLSSGKTNTQVRDLPFFREIVLYDKINVILKPDSVQKIIVEAGTYVLSGITTTVSGDQLTIQDNSGCKMFRTDGNTVNVYISNGGLQKISYHGAGNVSSTDTIRQNHFTIDCDEGSGSINLKLIADSVDAIIRTRNADITLSGHSNHVLIYCAGEGSVDLTHFTTRDADVETKSIRDNMVNVTGNLYAFILYLGNVYYTGSPVYIQSQISSSGKLIPLP
jgi:Putative auto-transporter adhesin, head GIN domain